MQLTHGSLFDGAGGMRLGFEQAGIKTVWTLDILNGQDARTAEPFRYRSPDIISGGPPCTRGSTAARLSRQRSYETLWPEMLRFIIALRPLWVVVENVTGFKREMVDWSLSLQQLGYGCCGRNLDSRHWLPQHRSRYFVCARMGVAGVDLWPLLYPDSQRSEGRGDGAHAPYRSRPHAGNCADCLPGGIFARFSSRRLALMGAGNAVSVPVSRWLAECILDAERECRNSDFLTSKTAHS